MTHQQAVVGTIGHETRGSSRLIAAFLAYFLGKAKLAAEVCAARSVSVRRSHGMNHAPGSPAAAYHRRWMGLASLRARTETKPLQFARESQAGAEPVLPQDPRRDWGERGSGAPPQKIAFGAKRTLIESASTGRVGSRDARKVRIGMRPSPCNQNLLGRGSYFDWRRFS